MGRSLTRWTEYYIYYSWCNLSWWLFFSFIFGGFYLNCRKFCELVAVCPCSIRRVHHSYYVGCCCNWEFPEDQVAVLWFQTRFCHQVNFLMFWTFFLHLGDMKMYVCIPNKSWYLAIWIRRKMNYKSLCYLSSLETKPPIFAFMHMKPVIVP